MNITTTSTGVSVRGTNETVAVTREIRKPDGTTVKETVYESGSRDARRAQLDSKLKGVKANFLELAEKEFAAGGNPRAAMRREEIRWGDYAVVLKGLGADKAEVEHALMNRDVARAANNGGGWRDWHVMRWFTGYDLRPGETIAEHQKVALARNAAIAVEAALPLFKALATRYLEPQLPAAGGPSREDLVDGIKSVLADEAALKIIKQDPEARSLAAAILA